MPWGWGGHPSCLGRGEFPNSPRGGVGTRVAVGAEFLQFTVGSYPHQRASRQGVVPTAEQICCTVGSISAQNSLRGRLLPTVNCRNREYAEKWLSGRKIPIETL